VKPARAKLRNNCRHLVLIVLKEIIPRPLPLKNIEEKLNMCRICVDYQLGYITKSEALNNAMENIYPEEHFDEILQVIVDTDEEKEQK
jgi:hypothetical protein